jgi:transcriptional regulator of nitric oxide reductase
MQRSVEVCLHRSLLLLTFLAGGAIVAAQPADDRLQARLKQLFPTAGEFSAKGGDPPHIKAYGRGPDDVIGYAFWTTELMPLERGYSGPIPVLVGLTPQGILTGIVMGEHREPYGDFSIDLPRFAAQFRDKDIRDPFRLGGDIDAVSRATITMASAIRGIRNSARRVARELLTPPGAAQP